MWMDTCFRRTILRGRMCRNSAAAFHEKMRQRFREASDLLSEYNLLTSPIYLEYLRGERNWIVARGEALCMGRRVGWCAVQRQLSYGL